MIVRVHMMDNDVGQCHRDRGHVVRCNRALAMWRKTKESSWSVRHGLCILVHVHVICVSIDI